MTVAKKLISDRWDIIEGYISNKSLLDLGCVDHEASNESGKHWLHRKMREKASKTLGVDYLPHEVEKLKRMGYEVVQGNVENLDLGKQFDVIVAGNIIEHLSNPGLFLDSVRKHLKDTGHFLITTDNCYGLRSLKGVMLHDGIRPNDEHTMTFEEEVFKQLLTRHGFSVVDFYYYNGPYPKPLKKWLIDSLCQIRKSWAWQMLAVAQKSS